jgi:hypothetical protein
MSKFLRGNFEPKNDAKLNTNNRPEDDLESRFERAALARLGGSIGYVSRKKFIWDGEDPSKKEEMNLAGRAAQYDKE